ncbi:5'-methylthioadenosine/adenosylhomocysteine nucleosidase [Ornithobacterium rhinotracheale]|uniref:5'-methylthioadenosine/S-adenosylhomocysteine nucleosidase n=2 Tax=Ornithobacterium rhinotracheale TaxID=28251 RepID=A0A3R5XUZ5_ORNRH|nr:5'-methylthioadenosine/adenosylhomocysteine nucleosidase [Ornithobacterium rhinotracheale]QAR31206.1 5'-methylthioadenosine/adenosylhomocysteine nucleosidase [Ornithobacterium rhinotracheale]
MKIGIIGAMEVEISLLCEKIENLEATALYNFKFYQGNCANHEIIVVLSGVGKVSAAVATTLLIDHYQPDLIINTGTAGGLQNVRVGDIILATEVRHHDVDLTGFGYELGQQSQMPAAFIPAETFRQKAEDLVQQKTGQAAHGLIVSGDAFINDPEKFAWIKENFPDAKAVEMEAAAIAQVCHQMNTPFIIQRAISDIAGEGNTQSFDQFVKKAGAISAEINLEFVKNL